MTSIGYSDPYCVFSVGEEKVTSSIKKKNLNPIYNEELKLYVDKEIVKDPNTMLRVECWDWDLLKSDDFIVTFSVKLLM